MPDGEQSNGFVLVVASGAASVDTVAPASVSAGGEEPLPPGAAHAKPLTRRAKLRRMRTIGASAMPHARWQDVCTRGATRGAARARAPTLEAQREAQLGHARQQWRRLRAC